MLNLISCRARSGYESLSKENRIFEWYIHDVINGSIWLNDGWAYERGTKNPRRFFRQIRSHLQKRCGSFLGNKLGKGHKITLPPSTPHLTINPSLLEGKRVLFVGDVHGCFDELEELYNKCTHPDKDTVVVFVGDLVFKGPKTLEVIRFARETGSFSVRGNHEQSVLTEILHKRRDEPVRGVPLPEQDPLGMIFIRNYIPEKFQGISQIDDGFPWASMWNGPQHVVFGHDARRDFSSMHMLLVLTLDVYMAII
ncbi:hypothetical protein OS493_015895 [Desmophyllum pertusum]|uniref:Calcineurin-like phosphoesterase domain-containing protein n=1 Tax=Desmophyllum pertusum TaxID=174260 RepID=A0A9W9YCN6_9CNID|nr:hypothetical protein OS493_015895 [Desmophyllum pertusum]